MVRNKPYMRDNEAAGGAVGQGEKCLICIRHGAGFSRIRRMLVLKIRWMGG